MAAARTTAAPAVVAFLIDADNLSSPALVDEACQALESSESMRKWAIRPFCNLSLGKNTTDIALAIDAMELACQTPAPEVIAIGSGDADFLPSAVRFSSARISSPNILARAAIPAR